MAHNSYLINLASPDPFLYERSLEAFMEEMGRANFLGVPHVVVHPGAHMGAGENEGIVRIAAAINRALAQVPPPVEILLENTAGQGSCLGYRFEHLAALLDRVTASGARRRLPRHLPPFRCGIRYLAVNRVPENYLGV